MMNYRPTSGIYQRLNRHASTLVIGGIFLFFSSVAYMMICGFSERNSVQFIDHSKAHKEEQSLLKAALRHTEIRNYAFLVVLVLTGPDNKDKRNAIRKTWVGLQTKDVKVYFVIGTKDMVPEKVAHLNQEQSIHSDMLLLKHVQDAYEKLTEKVLQSFIWLDLHIDYKYVLKADDDTYARIDILFSELKQKRTNRLYWGFFNGNAQVKLTGIWAEKNWMLCDRYLPYARGGGYILSSDLVHYLSAAGQYLKKFNSEDVSVGAWLGPLDINRLHDPRFDTEYRSRGCHNSYLVTHKISIDKMTELHNNLLATGNLCSKEFKLRNSYKYNWNVLPSRCCLRNDSSVP